MRTELAVSLVKEAWDDGRKIKGGFAAREAALEASYLFAAFGSHKLAEDAIRDVAPENSDDELGRLAIAYARGGDLPTVETTIARIRDAGPDRAVRPGAWLGAARAFAKRGQTRQAAIALDRARHLIVDHPRNFPMLQGELLGEIAELQFTLGNHKAALDTFHDAVERSLIKTLPGGIPLDPENTALDQEVALSYIVRGQVKLGLLSEARQTALRASSAEGRSSLGYSAVAALATSANPDDGLRMLSLLGPPWTKDRSASPFAHGYLRAGRLNEAEKWSKRLADSWNQVDDLEARILGAIDLASLYRGLGRRDVAALWLDRAAHLVVNGTIVEGGPFAGLNAIDRVPGSMARQRYLGQIAKAQAKLGLTDAARHTFVRLKEAAHGEQPGLWEDSAINCAAQSQADAGFVDDALQTVNALPATERRRETYVDIACGAANHGDLDRAYRIIDSYISMQIAAPYLCRTLLKMGDLHNALKIALIGDFGDTLRAISREYTLKGDLNSILQLVRSSDPKIDRVSLLLGAADALLQLNEEQASTAATQRGAAIPHLAKRTP